MVADASGARVGVRASFDPFGQPIDPGTGNLGTLTADDATANTVNGTGASYGWLGSHEKLYEHQGSIATIEMGCGSMNRPSRLLPHELLGPGRPRVLTQVLDRVKDAVACQPQQFLHLPRRSNGELDVITHEVRSRRSSARLMRWPSSLAIASR